MIQTESAHITLPLEGYLTTNSQGIRHLLEWYSKAQKHQGKTIITCCEYLDWIDANLAALWSALMHKLRNENDLSFQIDEQVLSRRFAILIRNGFSCGQIPSHSKTFIQNACFGPDEGDPFLEYVESELLQQQEMKKLPASLRGMLENNLCELYQNVYRHAATTDPFFICGQYFPKRQELAVSMVDLGQTFLPPIQKRTNGEISTQRGSIEWALQGNSELGRKGGGHALKCIRKKFDEDGHCLQIVTGNTFWDSEETQSLLGPYREYEVEMPGTMVNLIFKTRLSS